MATFMQQFKILMWKNIMLKLRNKRQVLQVKYFMLNPVFMLTYFLEAQDK